MSEPITEPTKGLLAIRIAVLMTAFAVVLGLALLLKETPYVFTAFMVLGPLLLAAALLLLSWVIIRELQARRVL